jgi:Haemolysin-type calcium binding protein related domain
VFGAGINLVDLVLQRGVSNGTPTNDQIIRVQNAGTQVWNGTDELTVKNWFESTQRIEWLRFANGDEIRIGDITSFKLGTGGNDVIVGTNGGDFLYGFDGLRRTVIQTSLEVWGAANDNFITFSQAA